MSRETENFSMYSLMSIRTSAFSSLNRNSASARASSVFPTPVLPRNMNEPIGFFASCSPARERRMASLTALTASGCAMTRSSSRSSRWRSLCLSLSSIRETGMPVHRATISAMSSASTSSLSIFWSFWTSASLPDAAAIFFPRSAIRPYRSSATRARSPSRSFFSASVLAFSTSPFIVLIDCIRPFSTFQCALRAVCVCRRSATSASRAARRSLES